MTTEIDHANCPADAHDFTYDKEAHGLDEQRHIGSWFACNDCGAVTFYCTVAEWYFHAGGWQNIPDCFLAETVDVPMPAMNDGDIATAIMNALLVAQEQDRLAVVYQIDAVDPEWLTRQFALYVTDDAARVAWISRILQGFLDERADEAGVPL